MTRVLLASAVVMDAAGWMCAAQGAYGLARVCFSAAVPFIAAWALASLRGRTPYFRPARCPTPTWRGGGTAPFGGGAPSGCIYRCGPPARDWLNE